MMISYGFQVVDGRNLIERSAIKGISACFATVFFCCAANLSTPQIDVEQ